MHPEANSLAGILREPGRLRAATLADWDRIVPEARQAGLLARLANHLEGAGAIDDVPPRVRAHLVSARMLADKHRRDVRFEIDRLSELLGGLLGRIILLKGAAYLAADLPPARGRLFNDIDILVPKSSLETVEAMLGFGGWRLGEMDPYDERYYRRWMHQLPPLSNANRQSTIDVHHTIVPSTARAALEGDRLVDAAMDLPSKPGLAVLAPPDMILHSAVHLFNEGEYPRGLRDLDDLNLLLRHFGREPGFWDRLANRAEALGLTRPLFYMLRYAQTLLRTPVPEPFMRSMFRHGPKGPGLWLMDALFERALRSPHANCRDALTGPALSLLYIRSHYLRMPLHLLIPHLVRKAMRPRRDVPETA